MAFLQPGPLNTSFEPPLVSTILDSGFIFHDQMATLELTTGSSPTLPPGHAGYNVAPGRVVAGRKKRRLDYIKCGSCRKDKQKCLPRDRKWPQRCARCIERNLPCSEGDRAQRHAKSIRSVATASPPQDTTCSEFEIEEWAFLVTFRAIILSAVACLETLKRDMSAPFSTVTNLCYISTITEPSFEMFLHQLDSEIIRGAIRLWITAPLISHPSLIRTLLARQIFIDCPLRDINVCPIRQGFPAIDDLSKDKDTANAFLVACGRLKYACTCADCERPNIHFRTMSDRYHEKAEGVLKSRNLWDFLPFTARRYASYLPAGYTHSQAMFGKLGDIEDCLGRNTLIHILDYLDENCALATVQQLLVSVWLTGSGEAKDKIVQAINHQDILGRSALHIACQKSNEPLVELLLSQGATPVLLTVTGALPLHSAAAADSINICKCY